jgi:hypothetical protein
MNGKGSNRRPSQVSQKQLAENWERTFRHEWAERYGAETPYIEQSGEAYAALMALGRRVTAAYAAAYGRIKATAPQAKRTSRR